MEDIERANGKCFVVYDDDTINEVKDYIESIEYDSSKTSEGTSTKP
jgi:uncharacterized protein YlzI (FlbEa/FlbD family)